MSGRRIKRNPKGEAIAKMIMEQYSPESREDMQEAMKDIFGPIFEAMLQGEMDEHLGYASNDHGSKKTSNRRNGYTPKNVKTSYGEVEIAVPRDRESSFEPQIIPKRTKDVSGIEDKVLSMYARGMSQRDIAETIEEIYGFEISSETISKITDRVLDQVEEWQNRPLKKFYTFLFVDCMYVTIRREYETKSCAVYVILGYDVDGVKDILGLWISESEGKHQWMQIFDEIKARGVEDVLFISMDGVSGLEEGAKLGRGCQSHIPSCCRPAMHRSPYQKFHQICSEQGLQGIHCSAEKGIWGTEFESSEAEFERFKQAWSSYPGAVDVWIRNWQYVVQMFNYGSAVRKVMYTTNAIESVNSSFRKVTKKGAFPSEDALLKLLYLRITELYKKWNNRSVPNWALVRNQLAMDDSIQERIRKYEKS